MKIIKLIDKSTWDRCRSCGRLWDDVPHGFCGRCQECYENNRFPDLNILPMQSGTSIIDNLEKYLQDLILPIETLQQFKYEVRFLDRGSPKPIVHKCPECLESKATPFKLFVQGKNLRHTKCKTLQTQRTNLKRYGVVCVRQSTEIKEKIKQRMIQKYKVENYQQLPENRNKLKDWCVDNPNKTFTSRPELEILQWVQSFYPNSKKYKDGTHEIDIFISEINLGIEHNGLYHHQENVLDNRCGIKVGQRYHLNKTKHFKDKGIRIIHVFEHEWRDRQEQVKSFLLSAMGKNEIKIGARKCQVLWSNSPHDIQETYGFLEVYHIQGAPNYGTKFITKAMYNNEIVAVATFGRHHRNGEDWVLTRFCTKTNYTIQGILSKMSKLASQQLKADMLSWADYRLSNGNGYEKAGWIFEQLLPPDYFYHKNGKVFSKQSRQKKAVKTPVGMTERQHAEIDGLNRIFDCGKIRYKYVFNNVIVVNVTKT